MKWLRFFTYKTRQPKKKKKYKKGEEKFIQEFKEMTPLLKKKFVLQNFEINLEKKKGI